MRDRRSSPCSSASLPQPRGRAASRSGSTCSRYSAVELAGGRRRGDAGGVVARRGRGAGPGPAVGQDADLAQAAPVGVGGDLEQAGAGVVARRRCARRRSAARARRARRAAPCVRRSPQTITTSSPASRSSVGDGARPSARRRPRPRRARRDAAAAERRAAARRRTPRRRRARSARRRRRWGPATTGRLDATASLTPLRRTPLRMRRSSDRHVVDRLAVEHEHGVGELEVGDRRLQRRGCASAACSSRGRRPAARASRGAASRAPSRMRRCSRKPSSFVVSPPASAPTRPLRAAQRAAAASSSARSQLDRAQLAAVAHQRLRDALVDVDGLVGEAALVAQPAVVDARRCRARARAGRARRGR